MKKVGMIVVIILILCGCTSKIDEDQLIYNGYVEEMKEIKTDTTSEDIVNVEIELEEETDGEITYRVTIDQPKEEMKDIEAMVYHTEKTDDIYPTIGVFDKKLNLIPGLKDNKDNNVKGIVLGGFIKTRKSIEQFHPTFKIMILYNNKENERKKIYYIKKF